MTEDRPKLGEAFKLAYDSLVRTYTPIIGGAVLAWLTSWLLVPGEFEAFVYILIAAGFSALWYLIGRLIEVIAQRATTLLTLGLVREFPSYAGRHARPELDEPTTNP